MIRYAVFLMTLMIFISSGVQAQTETASQESGKYGITFHGFIKSDYWYDTRQVVASREELFLLFPKNVEIGPDGKDVNGEDYVNFSPVTSRLTGLISGPLAFGARTSGMLEADFSGVTNADINGFRLRHAYAKLRWPKTELLFGQYWHPMFVTEVFPSVISLNTGAPFQPFIRNPQISLKHFYRRWNVQLAVLSQRDNSSFGHLGYSGVYLRNALVPNIHLQLQYKSTHNVLGVAADWKTLRPKLVDGLGNITTSSVPGLSAMAYWKFQYGRFTWRCKSIYGQNLTEHLLLGGYAVHQYDSITQTETYTPTNHLFLWGNITYGRRVVFGLFGGYAKNLGTTELNTGEYFSRGSDIAYMYRVAPSISLRSNNFQLSFEPEYTVAAYGTPDAQGIVRNAKEVGNVRLLLTIFYFF